MTPSSPEENPTPDLLVVGAGVVGAGIARDAALRGLSVVVLERWTPGWGTSSRTSRLIHGGIRYLETGDLALVREALRERATLLRIAPGLVRATPFVFVLERGAWWQWLRVSVGVLLYRLLARGAALGPHHPLTRRGATALEPLLEGAPIVGAARYMDARGDDLGIVRATLHDAVAHGAVVHAGVHAELVREGDGLVAILPDGRRLTPGATIIAAGPWTDAVRREAGLPDRRLVGGTKGIHVAFRHAAFPLQQAVALRHPDDRRVMFCVPEPERGRTYVGTTDTETDEPPDALTVAEDDVRYLLRAVQHYFPRLGLAREQVTETWAGVRPLLRQEGAESARSREHLILREGRVLTVAGGKFTTYRAMAEEAVDRVGELLGRTLPASRTATEPLPATD